MSFTTVHCFGRPQAHRLGQRRLSLNSLKEKMNIHLNGFDGLPFCSNWEFALICIHTSSTISSLTPFKTTIHSLRHHHRETSFRKHDPCQPDSLAKWPLSLLINCLHPSYACMSSNNLSSTYRFFWPVQARTTTKFPIATTTSEYKKTRSPPHRIIECLTSSWCPSIIELYWSLSLTSSGKHLCVDAPRTEMP